MQEVTKALAAMERGEPQADNGEHVFDVAACAWASYALKNTTGRRLKLALRISKALANYANFDAIEVHGAD